MNISVFVSKLFSRSLYEGNRCTQKLQYKMRKLLGVDILKKYEHKLFGKSMDREQILNMLSTSALCKEFDSVLRSHSFSNEFLDNLKMAADKTMQGDLYILFDYRKFDFVKDKPHIDWYRDFATGYRYVNSHTYYCRRYNNIPGVDIKNVWELSRLQFLIAPALMWRLTGNPEYACFVRDVLLDWIDYNKYEEGPNWNVSIETGIRAYNMTLAIELISTCHEVSADSLKIIATALYLHMVHIARNQENYRNITYNHYLGGLIGTIAVGALFRKNSFAKKIYLSSKESFEHEILRQILDDGGSFEGTCCYHGFVGEIFSLAALLSRNNGNEMSACYKERLKKAVDFSLSLSNKKQMVQIGDNDSGRVLCILPGNPLDYSVFQNLALCEINGSISERAFSDELLIVCGKRAESIKENTLSGLHNSEVLLFPISQIACLKLGQWECILSAVEAQKYGMGGHTHNDKLSIVLYFAGKEIIVDPGSGCYTPFPNINMMLRSVKSHSTISVNGAEQNRKQSLSVLGNSYDAHAKVSVEEKIISAAVVVKNEDVSYTHERRTYISTESEFIVDDKVIAPSGAEILSRFVLHPHVSCNAYDNCVELICDDALLTVESSHPISIERGLFSPSYGKWIETNILCIHCLSGLSGSCETKTKFIKH